MKKSFLGAAFLLLTLCLFAFTACDNEEDQPLVAKPIINLEEVGEENSKVGIAGKDLHLEGEILAEGLIAKIDVAVTSTDGKTEVLHASYTEGKYIGVKNTTFHEHLDIPADASAGAYKLSFTVTDQGGQAATATSDLTIEVPAADAPSITLEEVGAGNSLTAVAGGEMHLEASIHAPKKIAEIEVELHNSAAKYEKVFTFTGDYAGKEEAHFHEHLEVPADAPAGEYHLHFTVTDAEGHSTTEEVEGVQITKN